MKPVVMIEDEENRRLVTLVRRIDEHLLRNQNEALFNTSTVSEGRSPEPKSYVQKKLGNGLRIRAQLKSDKLTSTLQIFLDPLRFRSWVKALGPLEFFYMDPFGIEIYFRNGIWELSVDKKVIPWQETDEIHEIACIEVQTMNNQRRLVRTV